MEAVATSAASSSYCAALFNRGQLWSGDGLAGTGARLQEQSYQDEKQVPTKCPIGCATDDHCNSISRIGLLINELQAGSTSCSKPVDGSAYTFIKNKITQDQIEKCDRATFNTMEKVMDYPKLFGRDLCEFSGYNFIKRKHFTIYDNKQFPNAEFMSSILPFYDYSSFRQLLDDDPSYLALFVVDFKSFISPQFFLLQQGLLSFSELLSTNGDFLGIVKKNINSFGQFFQSIFACLHSISEIGNPPPDYGTYYVETIDTPWSVIQPMRCINSKCTIAPIKLPGYQRDHCLLNRDCPNYGEGEDGMHCRLSDTRNGIGLCVCGKDKDCPLDMKCYNPNNYQWFQNNNIRENWCACNNHNQCEIMHSVNSKCIGTAFKYQNPFSTNLPYKPGFCSCIVGDSFACHNRGTCLSIQIENPEPYFDYETFNQVEVGQCTCWDFPNAFGNTCENDAYATTICNGGGRPVCESSISGIPIYSMNGNQDIVGYECANEMEFKKRGFRYNANHITTSACRCIRGLIPDFAPPRTIYIDEDGEEVNPLDCGPNECTSKVVYDSCATQITCNPSDKFAVYIQSTCQCQGFTDYYAIKPCSVGETCENTCIPNCSRDKCNNHGSCYYNPLMNPAINSENGADLVNYVYRYNNDCKCASGWKNSINPIPGEFQDTSITQLHGLCDQPYDILTNVTCGEGADTSNGPSFVNGQCLCKINQIASGYESLLQLAYVEYAIDSTSGLCARQCPELTEAFWNATAEGRPWSNAFQHQECGGPGRGTCVAATQFSSSRVCQCRNGYRGYACQVPICPRLSGNGAMCGGNGKCDESNGKCICNTGFSGDTCEIWQSNCGDSQTVLSTPNQNDLQFPNDNEVLF